MTFGSYSAILPIILLAYQASISEYSSPNFQVSSQLISLEKSINYKDRSGTKLKCKEKVSEDVEFESKKTSCKVNLTPEKFSVYYKRKKNTSEELSIQLNDIRKITNIGEYEVSEYTRNVPNDEYYSYPVTIRQVTKHNIISISFINPQNTKLEKVYISGRGKDEPKITSLLEELVDSSEACNLVDQLSDIDLTKMPKEWNKVYKYEFYQCNN